MKRGQFLLTAVITGLAFITFFGVSSANDLTDDEAFEIGQDAYIYGYPLVTMEFSRID